MSHAPQGGNVRFRDPYVYPTRNRGVSPVSNNATHLTSGGRAAVAAVYNGVSGVGGQPMGGRGQPMGSNLPVKYGNGGGVGEYDGMGGGGMNEYYPSGGGSGGGGGGGGGGGFGLSGEARDDYSQAKGLRRMHRRKILQRLMPAATLLSLAAAIYFYATCTCKLPPNSVPKTITNPPTPSVQSIKYGANRADTQTNNPTEKRMDSVAPQKEPQPIPLTKTTVKEAAQKEPPPIKRAEKAVVETVETEPNPKFKSNYPQLKAFALYPAHKVTGEEILSKPYAERLIVSQSSHAIYCPVPAALSSNWKLLLRKFEGKSDYTDLKVAHDRKRSGFRFLNEFTASEIDELLNDPSLLKFTFVRHPFHRMLSNYINKFESKDRASEEYKVFMAHLYGWEYVRKHDVTLERRVTFEEFVNAVILQGDSAAHEHWASQSSLCGLGHFPYDFVGKFERVETDAPFLLKAMGRGGEKFPTQDDLHYKSSGAEKLFSTFYTPSLETLLREKFQSDVTLLEYS